MKEFVLEDETIVVPDKPKKRGNVLIEAYETINGNRQDQYGNPEDNFQTIANLWSDYLGGSSKLAADLTAKDVAIMMALLKIARLSTGTAVRDSFVDAAGYIGLAHSMENDA